MVSLFSGEVNRTWRFEDASGATHEVSLYHHPLTGARAAMLDHEEMPGSLGTSSLIGSQTMIPFNVHGRRGSLTIRRASLGFAYACFVDGVAVAEATAGKAPSSQFSASVKGAVEAVDKQRVTWYIVETRKGAQVVTVVHRRFRDFADLDESVHAALAGHHMRSSLPRLPAKRFKFTVDHNTASFVQARRHDLDSYVSRLVDLPHAWAAPATAPFFGVAHNAREYSVLFTDKKLGFTLGKTPAKTSEGVYEPADFPAFVASVDDDTPSVAVGDLVSKISGLATCAMPFKDVVSAIKHSQRPILLHFIAALRIDDNNTDVFLPEDDPFKLPGPAAKPQNNQLHDV